jgi:peptide chain release factor 1
MKRLLFSETAKDFRFEFFSAGGPGGQHQQKKATACRCVHIESKAEGISRDERQQSRNKENAFIRCVNSTKYRNWHAKKVAELLNQEEITVNHRTAGFGDEKIRTYNFKDNRVTNHVTGTSFYNLDDIMNGDLDSVIDDMMLNRTEDV